MNWSDLRARVASDLNKENLHYEVFISTFMNHSIKLAFVQTEQITTLCVQFMLIFLSTHNFL